MMATSPFESAALVAAVRRDMAELAAAEFHWEGLDPIAFQRVIADFIDDDHRFRASPPAEVAGLIRVVEGHPGWVEPEIRTRFIEVRDSVLGVPGRFEDEDLGAARAGLQEPQLGTAARFGDRLG